ncbi:MAG: urease accessory protein UreD [Deltaproteobacteria bacterium]|nr:urease accessory protein UreD [Deltaproteobacteria bacterium]
MDRTRAALRLIEAESTAPSGGQLSWTLPRALAACRDEPLIQRPAGSAGKDGVCELTFAQSTNGTHLRRSFVTHPFHLTAPWHLDPTLPGMAVVYLQTPAGGLIQGDRARLRIDCGPHTQVHLTTQAAEKIHTMTANCAVQQAEFTLDTAAYAEYCPEPIILFPGARFAQSLEVTLGRGACMFLAEIYLSRRSSAGATFDAFSVSVRVRDDEAGLLLHERNFVLPGQHSLDGPGVLGGYPVWGQAFLVGPEVPSVWVRDLHDLLASVAGVVGGATLLPRGRGVGVKVAGAEVRGVRQALFLVWNYLRWQRLGVPAATFPK